MAKLKYNIQAQIDLLPRGQFSIQGIENILLKDHGISRDIFYRDRKIKIGSASSIPENRLQIYAGLFEVSVDDLKNEKIKVKPLSARKPSDFIKKIGLKPAKT